MSSDRSPPWKIGTTVMKKVQNIQNLGSGNSTTPLGNSLRQALVIARPTMIW